MNVDSDETFSRIIGGDPLFFFMDHEMYPLTTRENHEKQILEILHQ